VLQKNVTAQLLASMKALKKNICPAGESGPLKTESKNVLVKR
jgi:hypothetical protein